MRELAAHLAGEITPRKAAVELARQETRRYAKRQLTWLRNQIRRTGRGSTETGARGRLGEPAAHNPTLTGRRVSVASAPGDDLEQSSCATRSIVLTTRPPSA